MRNLSEILGLLRAGGVEASLDIEAGFARGLEYYTGMVFEIFASGMDIAVGGGGRYDKLIELFGGGQVPAVGVAPGIDRLSLALQRQGSSSSTNGNALKPADRILVMSVDGSVLGEAFKIASRLRKESGVAVELETMGRSVSKALSDADRRGITHAVIVGPREIREGKIVLRDMAQRTQETVTIEQLLAKFRKQG